MSKVKIIKASGRVEFFSREKLRKALERSGAKSVVIESIIAQITAQLREGITTRQIYRQTFELLKQYTPSQAARFKLKQAINELGPSGFPFERFVEELLKEDGYKTQTGVLVQGHCVKHEIDVVAEKNQEHFMIECKFHNGQGVHSDVKIPLYIYSRFLDVENKWKELAHHENKFHQAWIVTNTRFTIDAINYGTCMGMNLIGWDYPRGKSLKDRIDFSGLHPITSLTTLTGHEKKLLLEKGIVLCKEFSRQPGLLKQLGIADEVRKEKILLEGEEALPPVRDYLSMH